MSARTEPKFLEAQYIQQWFQAGLKQLQKDEDLTLNLEGEYSQFVRFNAAKVRQIGEIQEANAHLTFQKGTTGNWVRIQASLSLTGIAAADAHALQQELLSLRLQASSMPIDPYAQPIEIGTSSFSETQGQLLPFETAVASILDPVKTLDFCGLYAAGTIVRALATRGEVFHWFKTESFHLDFSVYNQNQQAHKGGFSGTTWDPKAYQREIDQARVSLERFRLPIVKLQPGAYRTYLAPAAVSDLVHMFSWNGISENAIRQGQSPLVHVRNGERSFSPLFSMTEDFSSGLVPRFNSLGEISPLQIPLFQNGKLENTLVSSRTAQEYQIPSNFAAMSESLRSTKLAPGHLAEEQIIRTLGTGLYLSQLHYLNWSDLLGGRITGMTRFACFWVENGEIQGPIQNLRFDETLFHLFGAELEALTAHTQVITESSTYEKRNLGVTEVPGILVKKMHFTL